MRVCDLHVCMCFCGHFDEEKILPTFFSKKIILPPLILNINNNKIITSVPVYEKMYLKQSTHNNNTPHPKNVCVDLKSISF